MKPHASSPALNQRGVMFHGNLVMTSRSQPSFFEITSCLCLALGQIILLPRLSGMWSLAMLLMRCPCFWSYLLRCNKFVSFHFSLYIIPFFCPRLNHLLCWVVCTIGIGLCDQYIWCIVNSIYIFLWIHFHKCLCCLNLSYFSTPSLLIFKSLNNPKYVGHVFLDQPKVHHKFFL